MSKLLSNPGIEVNNDKIAIYGNSASYDNGLPEASVTSVTAGEGAFDVVVGVDGSTAVGEFKFKLPTTAENDALVTKWKRNPGGNVVKFYEGSLQKTMLKATVTSPSAFDMDASEGGVEVIFRGKALEV
jgi:hypothetical protein